MITKLSQIVEEAQKKGRKRLAVAYGQDSHTLSAVYDAYKEGLVEPTLYGDKQVIEEVCGAEGIDCSIFKIVDEKSDVNCVRLAVAAVVAGDADVLMKGLVSTDKYMRGILNKDAGLFPPKGVLSHVAILEMPSLPQTALHLGRRGDPRTRLQAETEADRIPHPDCQAAGHRHAENRLHRTLGTSAAERSVVDRRGHPGQNGRPRTIGQCDRRRAAVAGRSALQGGRRAQKVRGSAVAGDPDCLLFPNIESANVFFKAATHFGGAELAAMVMGTKVPCVLTLARRLAPDQDVLHRTGLPGRPLTPWKPRPNRQYAPRP